MIWYRISRVSLLSCVACFVVIVSMMGLCFYLCFVFSVLGFWIIWFLNYERGVRLETFLYFIPWPFQTLNGDYLCCLPKVYWHFYFCFAAHIFYFCCFSMFEMNENLNLDYCARAKEGSPLTRRRSISGLTRWDTQSCFSALWSHQLIQRAGCGWKWTLHTQRSLDLRVKPSCFLLATAPTTELPHRAAQLIVKKNHDLDSYICATSYRTGNDLVPRFSRASLCRQSIHVTIGTWHVFSIRGTSREETVRHGLASRGVRNRTFWAEGKLKILVLMVCSYWKRCTFQKV